MSKNSIIKVLSMLSVSLFMLPISTKASEVNNNQSKAESIAQQYLSAAKENNIDKILRLSQNEISQGSLDEKRSELTKFLSDPNNQIENFSILGSEKLKDYSLVKCQISYKNGQVIEDKMKVVDKVSSNPYVSVELVENSTEKVIKKGKQISSNNIMRLNSQLTSWSTAVDAGDVRYSPYFSSRQSYVDLNYRNGGNIRYRVVKYGLITDEARSWAAETGANPGSPHQVRLNAIPGKSFDGVKLQISCWATPGGFTFGEIYA